MHFKYTQLMIVLFLICICSCESADKKPHLLIKMIGTDSNQIIDSLDKYNQKLSGEIDVHFLITHNVTDKESSDNLQKKIKDYPNSTLNFIQDHSISKLYNDGVDEYVKWFDVLLVVDANSTPVISNYDKIIIDTMNNHFKNNDGVINYHGEASQKVNRFPIMGKKYYQRFGYVYNPDYSSSFYGDEFSNVSRILGKEVPIDQSLFMTVTSLPNPKELIDDKIIFVSRQLNNYGIKAETLKELFPKDWSILICTMTERAPQFNYIHEKLLKQIAENNLDDCVEVLSFLDNRGEHTVGFKRNELVRQSQGRYICFIDDDDDIHDEYIKMIHDRLKNDPDCVSLLGVITFNGMSPKTFVHSIQYKTYFQDNTTYYRPPIILIQYDVLSQFNFFFLQFLMAKIPTGLCKLLDRIY